MRVSKADCSIASAPNQHVVSYKYGSDRMCFVWCWHLGKLDKFVLELLANSSEPLTLVEIAQKLDKQEKVVYKTLKRLFEKGQIDAKGRQYSIAKD